MKLLFWIIGVPLLLLAAFFAIANRELVTVSLWPVADPVEIPLFVAIVAPLYFGVMIGVLAGWWSGAHRARTRRRSETRRAEALEQEVATLRSQLKTFDNSRAPMPGNNVAVVGQGVSPGAAPPSFMP
jgi:putative membrane protein